MVRGKSCNGNRPEVSNEQDNPQTPKLDCKHSADRGLYRTNDGIRNRAERIRDLEDGALYERNSDHFAAALHRSRVGEHHQCD